MKPLVIAISAILLATSASADVTELSQSDLRAAIAADRAIPTRSLVSGVENFTGGEVLDIRAFIEGQETFIYRILYRGPDGDVQMLLVDGGTGRQVASASSVGQSIAAFVGANPGNGQGNGNAFGRANRGNGLGNGRNNGNNGGNNNRGGGGGNGNGRDR